MTQDEIPMEERTGVAPEEDGESAGPMDGVETGAPDGANGGDVDVGSDADGGPGPDGAEVSELRQELDDLNDRHLRLAAEFDNYRKRNQRDREALATRLQADLVGSLLDVLDDLERVAEGGEDVKADAVLEGVQLVEKKFRSVLEGAGVTPVDAEDARFDPELMEALGMVPTDDPEKDGHVADVFQRGYRLRDVLIRPARVRVYQQEGAG